MFNVIFHAVSSSGSSLVTEKSEYSKPIDFFTIKTFNYISFHTMASLTELPSYTLMQLPPDLTGEPPNEAALKADFEKGDTKTKIAALKKVLYFILNGEKFPHMLMTIIRFVLPSQVTLTQETQSLLNVTTCMQIG